MGHKWEIGGGGRFLWCSLCENSIRPQAATKAISHVSIRPAVVWINEATESAGIPACTKTGKRSQPAVKR